MRTKAISAASLGQILKGVRKKKGLSQSEAGSLVGIDQPTLSKIERGESNVRIDTLFRLLAALDLELFIRPREKMPTLRTGDDW